MRIQERFQQGCPLWGQVYYSVQYSLLCSLRTELHVPKTECISIVGTFSGTLSICQLEESKSILVLGQEPSPSPKQYTSWPDWLC